MVNVVSESRCQQPTVYLQQTFLRQLTHVIEDDTFALDEHVTSRYIMQTTRKSAAPYETLLSHNDYADEQFRLQDKIAQNSMK